MPESPLTKQCDECGSVYRASKSQMAALCPECAHYLYGYPNCAHEFEHGRCVLCHWDGSVSDYVKTLKSGNAPVDTEFPDKSGSRDGCPSRPPHHLASGAALGGSAKRSKLGS